MERIVIQNKDGSVAVNGRIVYSEDINMIGLKVSTNRDKNWIKIYPKYYIFKDDNSILEIWYDGLGMILNGKLKDYVSNAWSKELREEIDYEKAMRLLKMENKISYNNKDLMSREKDLNALSQNCFIDDLKENLLGINKGSKQMNSKGQEAKQNNNSGDSDCTPDYYGARCKCGEKIDAYTICDKYAKPHKGSAWHHALKKLLRAGDGHKKLEKDINEVIDSLKRWKEQINSKAIEKD